MPASIPTRAIDRLRKAANLEPTKKQVELSDGSTIRNVGGTPDDG
jgi:hypothetical protein